MPSGLLASRLGQAWWTRAKNYGGNVTLTPTQEAQGLAFWTGMATDLITELTNAKVDPGTFVQTSPSGGPVTGIGGPIS